MAIVVVCKKCRCLVWCESYGFNLLSLLLPGSISDNILENWKRRRARSICPACQEKTLVPLQSVQGQKLISPLTKTDEGRHQILELFKKGTFHSPFHDPKSEATGWETLAYELYEKRCYEVSLVCIDRSLDINPDSYEAWFRKGMITRALNRLQEAKECFQKAGSLGFRYADRHIKNIEKRLRKANSP